MLQATALSLEEPAYGGIIAHAAQCRVVAVTMAVKGPQSCPNYSLPPPDIKRLQSFQPTPGEGYTWRQSDPCSQRTGRQTEGQTASLDMDTAPPQEWKGLNRALAVGLCRNTL